MQRLKDASRRSQLGPGGAEVSRGLREPPPDLPEKSAARRLVKIRRQRDRAGQLGDVGQPRALDQRVHAEIKRRRNGERHTVLHRDLDDHAHIGLGVH